MGSKRKKKSGPSLCTHRRCFILLEWSFLVSAVLTYSAYLQSTIEVPSDYEGLIFGQHRLYEKQIVHNPNAKLIVSIRSTEARLGNQLFQYASSMGVVADMKLPNPITFCMHPKFHLGYLEEAVVGPLIPKCDVNDVQTVWEIGDAAYATHHEINFPPCPSDKCSYALKGYYQSWKYFDNYKTRVLQLFQFKPDIQQQAQDYFTKVSNDAAIKIGIHIRRTDMSSKGDLFYLRDPPLSYYVNAMNHFGELYGSIQYFVVSDDPDWCAAQEVFSKSVIVRGNSGPVDMAILGMCQNVITSRGSFGWWAAYLTGNTAIYYKDAFVMEHPENLGKVNLEDHYPNNWIGIGA